MGVSRWQPEFQKTGCVLLFRFSLLFVSYSDLPLLPHQLLGRDIRLLWG